MSYQIETGLHGMNPYLEMRDPDSGAVRLLWEYPRQAVADADPDLARLLAEEAVHRFFNRLFLLAVQQRLQPGSRAGATKGRHTGSVKRPVRSPGFFQER